MADFSNTDGTWLTLCFVGALGLLSARQGSGALVIGEEHEGRTGTNQHLTRTDAGTLPTSTLLQLPGARGEHRLFQDSPTGGKSPEEWEAFVTSIRKGRKTLEDYTPRIKSPVFVLVEWTDDLRPAQKRAMKGERFGCVQAFIHEGNHRVRAAAELGMTEVPVEVRFFGHSEREWKWPKP